jgi:hypothetical protein
MNLIERAKNMIITPKTEWLVISSESTTAQQVTMTYVLPLALAAAAAAFVGHGFLSGGHMAIGWGIYSAIEVLVSSVLSVFVSAFVVDALAPSFGSEKDFNRSARLVAYSYTPSLIGSLLAIYPPIGIIGSLFGLYGIYLWYLGLGPMKNTPEDKKVLYMIVSVVVLIVIWAIIAAILAAILMPIFGLSSLSRFGRMA